MRKILLLDDHFATGEQTVQPVLLWGPSSERLDLSRVTKTASEALDYIRNVVPEPGKTHMLVLALGGEETYGPNRNGDGFPERPIPSKGHRVGAAEDRYWVAPGEELTRHYQTFETNPAHAFLHHQNKDPKKASGQVKKAFWNDRMHRVELLVVVDNQKDPEWVQRVNDGDFPAVSMGCRIKYDVCSICGNRAPTRAQYCDHVRGAPGMNQLMPDGRRAYVHNPSPNFFDISRVFRPADRTGYTLKKVAHVYELRPSAELGEAADAVERKSAAIRKLSDIDKVVRGEPVASASLDKGEAALIRNFRDFVLPRTGDAPGLPVEELVSVSPKAAMSTLSALGVQMRAEEFLPWYVSALRGAPVRVAHALSSKVAALVPSVLSLYGESPALLDHVLGLGLLDVDDGAVDGTLAGKLAAYREKRAGAGEMLYRRLVPEGAGLRSDAAPTTDLLSLTDPYTGHSMQTTRGAAVDAMDARTDANLRKALGGGALLYGGYKLLSAFPSLRPYRLPLAAGAGLLGYRALRGSHPSVQSDQGLPVDPHAEFSSRLASESVAGAVVGLIDDYAPLGMEDVSRLNRGARLVERVKGAAWVDNIRGVEVDFEIAASVLGELICT